MTTFRLLGACLAFPVLHACAQSPGGNKPIGTPNPASAYCVKLGGRIEILKHADGSAYGMCHLPDGTSIEEWQLFRRDHQK